MPNADLREDSQEAPPSEAEPLKEPSLEAALLEEPQKKIDEDMAKADRLEEAPLEVAPLEGPQKKIDEDMANADLREDSQEAPPSEAAPLEETHGRAEPEPEVDDENLGLADAKEGLEQWLEETMESLNKRRRTDVYDLRTDIQCIEPLPLGGAV